MDLESLSCEDLRLRLADLGVPRDRQSLRDLLELLPVPLSGRLFDEFDASIIARSLLDLVGRGLIALGGPRPALDLRWGERACRAYGSHEALSGLVLPWFAQGVAGDERCIWVVGATRPAREILGAAEDYSPDQVELMPSDARIDWTREAARALAQGYRGLRIAGERIHDVVGGCMKTLCVYDAAVGSHEIC